MVDRDLSRLCPEHGSYFQAPGCQSMLRRILLLWCLRHPEYGYRQDARATVVVMRALKNVVRTGRTVACTIHQPSIDLFEPFDEVALEHRIPFSKE
ncbi:ABC transporter ATP-binding protein/permease PDR18-like [Vigna radiata var. radiata]|uniref:ABC transporter ATP-binding protein/permease PDR18-like n=1 Tax=Vigna radiata var. radiata TaxID=3916 RepID=A0A3Q0EXI7_VIGRR|nr:ABC transporter ATP-binding protein/permease PDR18-like [Vigna radiata var. radiata]